MNDNDEYNSLGAMRMLSMVLLTEALVVTVAGIVGLGWALS